MTAPDDQPLSPEEVDRLDRILLERKIPDAGLGIEFLDGYLTALICSPVEVDEAEWLDALMGETLEGMPENELDELLSLVTRLWNEIDTALDVGGAAPRVDLDADLPASRWCQGFMAATGLAGESWKGVARSHRAELLEPIVSLATPPQAKAGEEAPHKESLGRRARLLDGLADSVQALYDLWRGPMEPVRVQPKPGRNDPCPCGSGKKYKLCCGKGA